MSELVHHGATVASCAIAIRELGDMIVTADRHPDFRVRMEQVEYLADRVGVRLGELRAVVRGEYLGAMGVPPAGLVRPVHGGYPDGGSA